MKEFGHGTSKWVFDKYDEDQTAWLKLKLGRDPIGRDFRNALIRPAEVSGFEGNLVLNAGWTRLLNLLAGAGGQAYDATHTRIGVSDTATPAAAYTDTDLNGTTNKQFVLVSSAGTVGTRTLAYTASFTGSLANWAWNDFGIDNGTANGTTVTAPLLNHAISAQGTKASGQTWTVTTTLTFT